MVEIIGLFTEKLPDERIQWLIPFLKSFFIGNRIQDTNIHLYLTGSSIYSVVIDNCKSYWEDIVAKDNITVNIDQSEAKKLGFITRSILNNSDVLNKINWSKSFWKDLVNDLPKNYDFKVVGCLQLESPYQNRTSVYVIQLLNMLKNANLIPELYLYLDGLHMGLKNQNPSEFENIGNSIETIAQAMKYKDQPVQFLACSRCATSRGYVKEVDSEGNFKSDYMINPIRIVNLRKIIERFGEPILSLSSNCINLFNSKNKDTKKVNISILITHFPYDLEYTFGALSFAIGAMNFGLKTSVIFLEDGVFSLVNEHIIEESDKIFNIQDIIESTLHEENLKYYVLEESLNKRNLKINPKFKEIPIITNNQLPDIVLSDEDWFLNKIIFF